MWGLISAAIGGLAVGVVAKFLHPGKENMGILPTMLLGIGGALLTTLLGQMVGFYEPGERAGIVGGIVGAVVILGIYGRIMKNKGAAAGPRT